MVDHACNPDKFLFLALKKNKQNERFKNNFSFVCKTRPFRKCFLNKNNFVSKKLYFIF